MFLADTTIQKELFAYSPRDMVPDDSDVYLYIDLFDHLDVEAFYQSYSCQGQASPDSRLMLRAIFYGLTHGICSGRKLENACTFDNRFLVLSGGLRPSYRTFSRFIERHQKNIENLFVQVIRLASEMGLVSLGSIALDGTRLKGYTKRHGTVDYQKLDRAVEHIKEELRQLTDDLAKENGSERGSSDSKIPSEIKRRERRIESIQRAKDRLESEAANRGKKKPSPTAQISTNDPDARGLFHKKNGYFLGYNGQIAVDGDNQIIVAADLHDNSNDHDALPPILDQVKDNCKKDFQNVLVDSGYAQIENLIVIESHNAIACMPLQKQTEKERLEHLQPGTEENSYKCLAGYDLKVRGSKGPYLSVCIPAEKCENCLLSSSCRLYERRGKTVNACSHSKRQVFLRHMARMRTDEYKELYKRRKAIVEPVFGNLKANKNLRIHVVGKKKVATWWKLVCTALNIEKLVKRMSNNELSSSLT